jgi:hypothetical protein
MKSQIRFGAQTFTLVILGVQQRPEHVPAACRLAADTAGALQGDELAVHVFVNDGVAAVAAIEG